MQFDVGSVSEINNIQFYSISPFQNNSSCLQVTNIFLFFCYIIHL